MAYTYTLTPDDVYKFDWRSAIDGYEVVGFRPPESGDDGLNFLGDIGIVGTISLSTLVIKSPRLILRKEKSRKWMIEEVKPERATRIYSSYLVFNPHTNRLGTDPFVTLNENYDPDWIPVRVTEVADAD